MEAVIGCLPARLCMGTALTLALCSDLGRMQPFSQPTTRCPAVATTTIADGGAMG